MNRSYLLFSLWLCTLSVLAQHSPQRVPYPPDRIRFEQLTTADGLPENSVLALLQDHLGFMWLGTQNGLVRYDGTTMTTFRYDPKKPYSLRGGQIRTLYEDRNGDIWVGCESLFRYERATGRFIEYPNQRLQKAASHYWVHLIHEDKQGNIWTITTISATGKNLLDRLDPRTGVWTSFRHDPRNPRSLASDNIYSSTSRIIRISFAEALDGTIWVVTQGTTENTLHRWDSTTDQFVRFKPKASRTLLDDFKKASFVLLIGEQLYISSYENGLFRLSPKTGQLTQFRHDPRNPNSLQADTVSWLFRSRDGLIWVPTSRGLDRLDPRTGQFTHFVHQPNDLNTPSAGPISGLHEMPNGDIWFVSLNGLNLYNRQSGRFIRYEHDPSGAEGTFQGQITFSFLVDKNGLAWAGSWGFGLNKQSRQIHFPLLAHNPKNSNSLQSSDVHIVYEAPSQPGIVWFGTDKGLDRFDKKTGQYTHYTYDNLAKQSLGKGLVTALAEDKKGRFWVGTAENGLFLMDRKTGHFSRFLPDRSRNPNESEFQYVGYLLPAADGTLWMGSPADLSHLDVDHNRYTYYYQKADTYTPELFTLLRSITVPPRQIAAVTHPQSKVDETVPFTLNTPTDVCVAIGGSMTGTIKWDYGWIEDAHGQTVWEMTLENSKTDSYPYQRVEVKTLRLPAGSYRLRYRTDAMFHYGYWPIFPPIHADLWGVQVLRISPAEKAQLDRLLVRKYERPGLSGAGITTMREDAAGQIWTGSNSGGICIVNPAAGTFVTRQDRLIGPSSVLALLEDRSAGGWWVGDYANGLLFLNQQGKIIRQFNTSNGLPGNQVSAIQPDERGWLWVMADNGLCRFNPKTEQILTFTDRYGIPTKAQREADFSWRTQDGELYFWSNKGVNAFYPSRLQFDASAPPVVLTDLLINDQPATLGEDGQLPTHVSVAKEITLPHDQNDLTFHFAALSYNRGSESQYAYQLAPIDTGWVQNGTIRQARFLDLHPGTYTLRVKAANADGVWNEQGTILVVVIRPPWWQTWWAYMLYALALSGGIWVFIQYRSRALVRENRELEEKVARRTHQVQQQKNEIEQQKEEITAQRDHLEETLTELQATQAQLIQKEKLASLGELTAGIAHEIQNPLNFVNNFSEVSAELVDELEEELTKGETEEAKAIAGDLRQNLRKIHHHGGRAAAIVRGMLEHSRTDTGERRSTDLNALAGEYLNIAYHGLRARDKDFNCQMVNDFAPDLGRVEVVPQEIGRVLLNLYNNAFYAVRQRQFLAEDSYQPTIQVQTRRSANRVIIRVSDNGTGIPDAVKAKIFQPFFTTKPTGEGTGLGLSLSYDIVTKGHGGALTVASKEGEGTEFMIELPVQNT